MTDDVSPTNTPQTSNSEDEAKHTEPSSSKDTRSEFPLPVERTFIPFPNLSDMPEAFKLRADAGPKRQHVKVI